MVARPLHVEIAIFNVIFFHGGADCYIPHGTQQQIYLNGNTAICSFYTIRITEASSL